MPQHIQKAKGAAKLRRPMRRAAGLKVDNYKIYRVSGRRERRKMANIKWSNGKEALRVYVVWIGRKRAKHALASMPPMFPRMRRGARVVHAS